MEKSGPLRKSSTIFRSLEFTREAASPIMRAAVHACMSSAVMRRELSFRNRFCICRPYTEKLGYRPGSVGRSADAKPVSEAQFAAHDGAGHAGMDRCAHDWRGGFTREFKRSKNGARFPQRPGFFHRSIQGPTTYASRLEPAASSADLAGGWPHGGIGVTTGRIPASGLGTRYARRGSTRNQIQAAVKADWRVSHVASFLGCRDCRLACGHPARL